MAAPSSVRAPALRVTRLARYGSAARYGQHGHFTGRGRDARRVASPARPAGIGDHDLGVASADDVLEGRGPGVAPSVGDDDRRSAQLHYQTVKGALLFSPSPPRIPPSELRLVE